MNQVNRGFRMNNLVLTRIFLQHQIFITKLDYVALPRVQHILQFYVTC